MIREKAEHNESLCHFLNEEQRWPDWVITTAFYSALHYVKLKIFPLKTEKTEFGDFEAFVASQRGGGKQDKHNLLVTLVFQNIRDIYDDYRHLKDDCHNARYNRHELSQNLANKAVNRLARIKSVCCP